MDEQEKKHDNFWLSEMIRNTLSVCNAEQQKATEMAMEMIGREAFCNNGERSEPVMVAFALQMNGQSYTMRVPLLSLVPLPFLQIDNANLSFFVSIMSSKTNRRQGLKVSLSPPNKQLEESAVSQYDLRNNIRVEIKAEAQLPSPGLARLLQIAAANGMSIRPLHSATPPNTPNNTLREQ